MKTVKSIPPVVVAFSSCSTADVSCVGRPSLWPRTHIRTHCWKNVVTSGPDHLPMWCDWISNASVMRPGGVRTCTQSCPLVVRSLGMHVDTKCERGPCWCSVSLCSVELLKITLKRLSFVNKGSLQSQNEEEEREKKNSSLVLLGT